MKAQIGQLRDEQIKESEEERRQIVGAMVLFDSEQRERYWRDWEQRRTERYAIHQRGRLYPARHLLSMAVERLRYQGVEAGVAFLRSLGFEIVELAAEPQHFISPARPSNQFGSLTLPKSRLTPQVRGKRLSDGRLQPFQLTLAPAHPLVKHYRSEREFEQSVIAPLMNAWGCHFEPQVTRIVYRGEVKQFGRIDFVVRRYKNGSLVTVIEAKRQIRSLAQLYHAAYQAESYARALRLAHFVIAAPEGCWIFSRAGRSFTQVEVLGAEVWDGRSLALKSRLFALAGYS